MAKHKKDKPKPPKTGGSASPYDYVDGREDDLIPAFRDIRNPDPDAKGSDLTPMRVVAMAELVRTGVPIPVSATSLGIPANAWKQWARNAREHKAKGMEPGFGAGESKFLYWLLQMDQARAVHEAQMVACIQQAALHDYKAACWLLERRASKRWHLQSRLVVEASATKKLEISTLSTDKLLQIARGLLPAEDIRETKTLPADVEDAELLDDEIASDD